MIAMIAEMCSLARVTTLKLQFTFLFWPTLLPATGKEAIGCHRASQLERAPNGMLEERCAK